MSIVVQKFGGTSLGSAEKIKAAARRAMAAQSQGAQVVMVVSATGKNTDVLVDLAHEITDHPPSREMDLLLSTGEQVSVALMAMAIHELGGQAVGMTGFQLGIETDSQHTKAKIRAISTDRVREALDDGQIVVAAGFQGIDAAGNVTTLGRGGSDTTAVALAAVLGASQCVIHTDVDGIYTSDPRVVSDARKLTVISYDEMLELSVMGAGVMHSRSVEIGKRHDIPIYVRSSVNENQGTWICADPRAPKRAVSGAALLENEARVTIAGVPDQPGVAHRIFQAIAGKNVAIDMIVQNMSEDGRTDMSFTVQSDDFSDTVTEAKRLRDELGARNIDFDTDVSKISIVGLGMRDLSGVAAQMFEALANEGINIGMITTSEIKVSVLVARRDAAAALRIVHAAFQLDQADESAEGYATPGAGGKAESQIDATELFEHLHSDPAARPAQEKFRESVAIERIQLNSDQGLVHVSGIPDTPGVAAKLFAEIARNQVNVDMIVQDAGVGGSTDISFTVPREQQERCREITVKIAAKLNAKSVESEADYAKLSVSGVGLRSHTDVAIRLFKALSEKQVNVELINTSEVLINVIVKAEEGQLGQEALEAAFADVMLAD